MSKIARTVIHTITKIREYQYKQVSEFAQEIHGKKILELGSGKKLKGKYHYSAIHLFNKDNDFLQTDIIEGFGHKIVDVTKMKFKSEFDIILCLNVLEHVYEYQIALDNMYKSLKKGGTAVIAVPTFYPLHDEPGDFWRFTEHSLRKLLMDTGFKINKFTYRGKREYPYTYYVEASKK